MQPWGVAEALRLGVLDLLREAGGLFASRLVVYDEMIPPSVAEKAARDLSAAVPGVPGSLCVGHPAACRALSQAAEAAGAQFVRGVGSVRVSPGEPPAVAFNVDGKEERLTARLVVGADGRRSTVREQAAIPLWRAEPAHLVSGLLVDGVPEWPQDLFALGTEGEVMFVVAPQDHQRVRAYTCTGLEQRERYAGVNGGVRFLADFRHLTCLPLGAAIAAGTPSGPCATLGGEDTWTDVPLAPGVALIGDAAGYNNPIIGEGLALALRDVRVLAELLLTEVDWSTERLMPYAEERGERLRRLRFVAAIFATLFTTFTPEGMARRARFFGRLRNPEDPAQIVVLTIRAGPERAPAWVFTEEFRDELLAGDRRAGGG